MKKLDIKKYNSVSKLIGAVRSSVIWLIVLSTLQSLVQVAVAVVTRFVIDSAISGGNLLFWGCVLVAVLLSLVVLRSITNWLSGSTDDRCVSNLRHSLLGAAVRSEDETLYNYHSGALLSRGMDDVYVLCDGVVDALPGIVGHVTRLIGAMIAVFIMYPILAGALALASLVVAAGVAVIRPILKARHKQVREAEDHVTADMLENLQHLELIRSLQTEKETLNRFSARLKNVLHSRVKRRVWSVGSATVISAISQLGTGCVLLWGAGQVAAGLLSYGSLAALLQLLALFRAPVLGLSALWTKLTAVEVAAQRLEELLVPEAEPTEVKLPSQISAVVFEDVTFSYPDDTEPVLEHFSARFSTEGWTCLTGLSGKGKTTIFKLILGLYVPQSGSVYLEANGERLICSGQTRKLFAYVPQDYGMFSGTVRENLLLAVPEATQQQRKWALDIAQADFLWKVHAGEDTLVKENNAGLSKGQIQRLAIARAVLMNRPIFLLDECTSALDSETERLVLQEIEKLGKGAIVVTHRPEALQFLENVKVLSMEA